MVEEEIEDEGGVEAELTLELAAGAEAAEEGDPEAGALVESADGDPGLALTGDGAGRVAAVELLGEPDSDGGETDVLDAGKQVIGALDDDDAADPDC